MRERERGEKKSFSRAHTHEVWGLYMLQKGERQKVTVLYTKHKTQSAPMFHYSWRTILNMCGHDTRSKN